MIKRNLIAIFTLFFVIGGVIALSKLQNYSSSQNLPPPLPSPTQSPDPTISKFTSNDKSFSFYYPTEWTNQGEYEFSGCDALNLSIKQTKSKLSAEKYLKDTKTKITPSLIDGHRALVFSDETKLITTAVIEATSSGQIIELNYYPSCYGDLTIGKQTEFYPLLNSFELVESQDE